MKLRQLKHALTKRVMTHRILRSGAARPAVRIDIKCDISGFIDGIARVNASMLRFSAAAALAVTSHPEAEPKVNRPVRVRLNGELGQVAST